jgi:hypothetical protein
MHPTAPIIRPLHWEYQSIVCISGALRALNASAGDASQKIRLIKDVGLK